MSSKNHWLYKEYTLNKWKVVSEEIHHLRKTSIFLQLMDNVSRVHEPSEKMLMTKLSYGVTSNR